MHFNSKMLRPSLVAAAVASALAAGSASAAGISIVTGTVGGTAFTPPHFADTAATSTGASTTAAVYPGATVFFDYNGNGKLDAGEPSATTAADGSFKLASAKGVADLVALIPTTTQATNTSINGTIASRNVFRASAAQVQAATISPTLAAKVDITPLTTEVARSAQFDGVSFAQAVDNLAQRIGISSADALVAPTKIQDATELPAILKESVIDTDRFQLAARFVDRGDPVGELRGNFDCAAVASFDPANADACSAADQAPVTDLWQAQNFAQNLEGLPRYDYVFVVIEENESLVSIVNSANVPFMNSLATTGSLFYNYYSTGNPSEPNYLALGGADDWGITGDEPGNLPYPSVTGVRQNIFNSLDAHGLSWRVYEESLWPSPAGTTANVGASTWNSGTGGAYFDNPTEATSVIPSNTGGTYSSGVLAKKHQPAVWYADVVAQPNYLSNSRTIAASGSATDANGLSTAADLNGKPIPYQGGTPPALTGNWDKGLQSYASSHGIMSWWTGGTKPWNIDQFKADLSNGDVPNYSFIVPDIKDDGHDETPNLSNQEDYFLANTVAKIKSSSIWNDPTKRVAIVVTFDEGESASTACCGWNPKRSGGAAAQPVAIAANGTVATAPVVSGTEAFNGAAYSPPYNSGNHGHGVTLFGLITNQQANQGVGGTAPHGHYDTDYYSHFSFVRTLQDVFGAADPGAPATYINRARYTETFIEQNPTVLPEFANSSNPHFDAVRAMNHVYQFPAGVARMVAAGTPTLPTTTGPDPDQVNLWAVK
jgi:Phosphoesterase family